MRRGQLRPANKKDSAIWSAQSTCWASSNIKSLEYFVFFFDEKSFHQDLKVNWRNDRWLCRDPTNDPTMHTKFLPAVMILGVVRNDGDVMPPYFFPPDYKEVWERVMRLRRVWAKKSRTPTNKTLHCLKISVIMSFQIYSLLLSRPESIGLQHIECSWEESQSMPP